MSAVTLSIEIKDPSLVPVGVVHVTPKIGAPTATHVKLRGIPWGTTVDGLTVMVNNKGAAEGRRCVEGEEEEGRERGGGEGRGRGGGEKGRVVAT